MQKERKKERKKERINRLINNGWLFAFYCISTFIGYLRPNSVYIYIYMCFNLRFLNEYFLKKHFRHTKSHLFEHD